MVPEQVRHCHFCSYCYLYIVLCSSFTLLCFSSSWLFSPYLEVFLWLRGKVFHLVLPFFIMGMEISQSTWELFPLFSIVWKLKDRVAPPWQGPQGLLSTLPFTVKDLINSCQLKENYKEISLSGWRWGDPILWVCTYEGNTCIYWRIFRSALQNGRFIALVPIGNEGVLSLLPWIGRIQTSFLMNFNFHIEAWLQICTLACFSFTLSSVYIIGIHKRIYCIQLGLFHSL